MNRKEAFDAGYERGWNFASWTEVPEIGQEVWTGADGRIKIGTHADRLEVWAQIARECERHDWYNSPFEHTAYSLNSARNSDVCWEAFAQGIERGIHDYARKRLLQLMRDVRNERRRERRAARKRA